MPTHFRNGVSRALPGSALFELPRIQPDLLVEYWNDFYSYNATDWTITTTEAGANDATEALANAIGGQLLITNDAADDDADFFQLAASEPFLWDATKRMWFKIRFKTSDATQSDIVFGLQITDTTPLAVSDGLYFLKSDGSTTMSFKAMKNSTATTTTAGTVAANTWTEVAFFYDPNDSLFHIFWNDVEVATSVTTNAVDDEELTVSFGIQNGEAVAKTMTIDYIYAAQDRAAYSWS